MPNTRDQFRAFYLPIVIFAIAGCSADSPSSSPASASASGSGSVSDQQKTESPARRQVSGVVTLDGQPLAGALVYFRPLESGTAAFGTTDVNGRYRLMFSPAELGVLPGRYQVRVTTSDPVSQSELSGFERIPRIYNEESTLYRDVTSETEEIPLALESDADMQLYERQRRGARRMPFQSVVLIVAEGLGPEWIGCYGGAGVETPNIDALAARGVKFTNVYSMPSRSASRVTLLTGCYPFRHGWVGDWDVPQSGQGCWFDWNRHQTVAQRLAANDFSTAIAGQWQLNDFRRQPDALLQHGFRRWCVWTGDESGNPPSRNQYRDPYIYLNRPLSRDADGWPGRNFRQYDWGGTGTFVDKFGPEIYAQFLRNIIGRSGGFRQFIYYPMTLPAPARQEFPGDRSPSDANEQYRALVRYTDQCIGDLVDWLDYTRERRRTIVIFTSDGGAPPGVTGTLNGRAVPGGRGLLTEGGIRVPLIVSCPSPVAAGTETDCLVDFSDLAPTICELAKLRSHADDPVYDGRSFAPVLTGQAQPQPREWIMSMGGKLEFNGQTVGSRERFVERVLRDRRYKVHVTNTRSIDALYDLLADPSELQNLVSSDAPEHAAAREKFQVVVAGLPAQDAELQYAPLADPTRPRTTAATAGPAAKQARPEVTLAHGAAANESIHDRSRMEAGHPR